MRNKNKTPGCLGFWVCVGTPLGPAYSEITNRAMEQRTGKACKGLITAYHQTFKPLISWSICSRTSSSIICRPVRHRHSSGAAQEPDGVNSFPAHARLRVCASINLSISGRFSSLQMWLSLLLMEPWISEILFCYYLFTFKPSEKAQRSDPFTEWDQYLHMFFLLCFLLPCQHVLCIRLYVLRCIGLYFAPLSGLLITSILSLKCNYVHHVMFLVERYLVRGGWARSLGFGRASTDGKQKHALKMGGRDLLCFSS